MSFFPGKWLISHKNKRVPRQRVVWKPEDDCNDDNEVESVHDQVTKQGSSSTRLKIKNSKRTDNQDASSCNEDNDIKAFSTNDKSSRGKKRRNKKPLSDQSSNSDDSEHCDNNKSRISSSSSSNSSSRRGNVADIDDEIVDERGLSDNSGDVPADKRKPRKKKVNRKTKKPIKAKNGDDNKSNFNNDHSNRDNGESQYKAEKIEEGEKSKQSDGLTKFEQNDWEDAGDFGGQISRCSSSSSLSSSCSHNSLIKRYTNIMMNCCDDGFNEDCSVVKNKIDRILKSKWEDRLNRSRERTSTSNESQSPTPTTQSSLKSSSTFKLRPARLPLNKKTWSKLKKSNQNTDWLFNCET